MQAYAIRANIPKNFHRYLDYFRKVVLGRCEEMRKDCVIEFLEGRIIIFTDAAPENLLDEIKGVREWYRITIFGDFDELVDKIKRMLEECRSFAIRSNRKAMEMEIGDRIVRDMGIEVNLTEPQCKIYVEKRGKFYLLFQEYPKHGRG